jgi:hypothetical protein
MERFVNKRGRWKHWRPLNQVPDSFYRRRGARCDPPSELAVEEQHLREFIAKRHKMAFRTLNLAEDEVETEWDVEPGWYKKEKQYDLDFARCEREQLILERDCAQERLDLLLKCQATPLYDKHGSTLDTSDRAISYRLLHGATVPSDHIPDFSDTH